MKLILGSKSITRQKILKEKGYKFTVFTANIDEKKTRDNNPKRLVQKLALAKSEAIGRKLKSGLLVTSDQITLSSRKILEKARNLKEAEKFLKGYSNRTVENITGVAVSVLGTEKQAVGVDVTKIVFKKLDEKVIQKALSDKYVLSYCGAAVFGQDIWKPYIKEIIGDKTALFGISINLMEKLIKDVNSDLSFRKAQKLVKDFAKRNNWKDIPNIDKIDHLHEELIEMSQHLRYKNEKERIKFVKENIAIFEDGIGDLVFGTFRLANQLGVDVEKAFNLVQKEILAKYKHKNREHNIIPK